MWVGTPGKNEKRKNKQGGASGVLDLETDLRKWFTRPLTESRRMVSGW